jgi:hypothetical protein
MAPKRDDEPGNPGVFSRGLPGTGGDIAVENTELDVEGHALKRADDADTRTGLYTGGPRTQGEFTRRGPGENPHGDR